LPPAAISTTLDPNRQNVVYGVVTGAGLSRVFR
jgi:hypothetical protein